ncbi:acetolactate decarboxylase [Pontibacter ruber]|uniref:Alpha-acetolactate decarboxylase n=1 Tax=Pontibacter ruber TaxID=1343895 RepID=A0ABW5CVI3_9BACT|nr:acetolactate decarboxylase [Pontibacter ruber]
MLHKTITLSLLAFAAFAFTYCSPAAKEDKTTIDQSVQVVGAMKNVMWNGQLAGTISLDTIATKAHLFGLGPVEYLAGELMIVDGKSYKSTVLTDSNMRIEETFDAKAPFFVYANVANWKESSLPDSIQSIKQLEAYLDQATQTAPRPFAFRLTGTVGSATIHIVNLPKGTKVSSPADAHQGQQNYRLTNQTAEIVGFFSTAHKAIFTHHDTYLHMHLLTADKNRMGHLDEVTFTPGTMKLYLPE